ncbi:hypothetical protein FRC08_010264 [Ceratobasidium sp. 394]|nr:hypothetical protein FRC08_010264 [Ceratobasidium sp. 394]
MTDNPGKRDGGKNDSTDESRYRTVCRRRMPSRSISAARSSAIDIYSRPTVSNPSSRSPSPEPRPPSVTRRNSARTFDRTEFMATVANLTPTQPLTQSEIMGTQSQEYPVSPSIAVGIHNPALYPLPTYERVPVPLEEDGDFINLAKGPVHADVATLDPDLSVGDSDMHTTHDDSQILHAHSFSITQTTDLPVSQIPSGNVYFPEDKALSEPHDLSGDRTPKILVAGTQSPRSVSPTPSISEIGTLPDRIIDVKRNVRGPLDVIPNIMAAALVKAGGKAQKIIRREDSTIQDIIHTVGGIALNITDGLDAASEATRTQPDMYAQAVEFRSTFRAILMDSISRMDKQAKDEGEAGLPAEQIPHTNVALASTLDGFYTDILLRMGTLEETMSERFGQLLQIVEARLPEPSDAKSTQDATSSRDTAPKTRTPTMQPKQATTKAKTIMINISSAGPSGVPKSGTRPELTRAERRAEATKRFEAESERTRQRNTERGGMEHVDEAMRIVPPEADEDTAMNTNYAFGGSYHSDWATDPPQGNVDLPEHNPPIRDEQGNLHPPVATRDDEQTLIGPDGTRYPINQAINTDKDGFSTVGKKGKAAVPKPKPKLSFADMVKAKGGRPAPAVPTVTAAAIANRMQSTRKTQIPVRYVLAPELPEDFQKMNQTYYHKVVSNHLSRVAPDLRLLEAKFNKKERFVLTFPHDTPQQTILDLLPGIKTALSFPDDTSHSRATTWSKAAISRVPTGMESGRQYSKEELLDEIVLNDTAAMLEITQGPQWVRRDMAPNLLYSTFTICFEDDADEAALKSFLNAEIFMWGSCLRIT